MIGSQCSVSCAIGRPSASGPRSDGRGISVKNGALSEELRQRMLARGHAGFSVRNEVRVAAGDAEGEKEARRLVLK